MKPTIYILACLFATNTSVAQTQTTTHDEGENSGKVIVRQQSVQRVDSFLMIDLTLDLTPLIVKSSRSVELTPLLSGGGHQDTLPAMLINGRTGICFTNGFRPKNAMPVTLYNVRDRPLRQWNTTYAFPTSLGWNSLN